MFTRKPDRDAEKEKQTEAKVEKEPAPRTESFDPAPSEPVKLSTPLKGSGQMAPSIIGEDLTVEGNIISKGEIQLEGEIKGDVLCASLIIGDKALIEGGVVAEDVIVRGRVTGSVHGHRVTLQSSSQVEGDIFHQSLAIEQGAYFEGKSRRSEDPLADHRKEHGSKSSIAASASQSSGSSSSSDSKSTRAAE